MTDYTRHKNIIATKGQPDIRCDSINSAKRLSRKLQLKGNTVRVIRHTTKPQRVSYVSYVKPWRPDNAD